MSKSLENMKIAVLATDGVEQSELTEPVKALKDEGAQVHVISPEGKEIQGFRHFDRADKIAADRSLKDCKPEDYDAIMLPGGALNADFMRANPDVIQFIKKVHDAAKPIAAICHAPWELISAGIVRGRNLTSFYTLKDDINHAGGKWIDQEVVVDRNLVTSRSPRDLPAFHREMINLFSKSAPPVIQVEQSA